MTQKFNLILIILGCIVFTYFILNVNRPTNSEANLPVVINTSLHKLNNERRTVGKTAIVIPNGLRPIKTNLIRTSFIGTVDHPTIDGGMINADDGMPIAHDDAIESKQSENKMNVDKMEANKNEPFDDRWVQSKTVKAVLEKAVSEGKLKYILNETEKSAVPASVAILPMVESSYNTHALSQKGAAGLWQIMPALANDYHLQSNDRFDFKKSTMLALNHINKLYNQFGNWELTLAAYNAGSKRVSAALHQNPNATTIEELQLPKETKLYIAKIKSINEILKSYK